MRLLLTPIFIISLLNCSFGQIINKQKRTGSHFDNKTACIGDNMDGDYVLMAWGKADEKSEALDQAKKNALNDIIFNGINEGNCQLSPLIIEVQAKEKYRSYIYSFFQKEYKDFIKIQESPKKRMKSKDFTSYGVKVLVMREQLRQKLITDQIIKL